MTSPHIPTLYEWAGGLPAFERLTEIFYRKVRQDPTLQSVFAHMDEHHPQYVARFVAEVCGGPPLYSRERGGHAHMIERHLGRQLTEPQRRRWVALIQDAADEAGFPTDPEFRSAFCRVFGVGHATRRAQLTARRRSHNRSADAGLGMGCAGWAV